jgi:hypothetical protein
MWRISYQLAVVLIACSVSYAVGQDVPSTTNAVNANDTGATAGAAAVPVTQPLTAEQIASFKKTLKDEKTGNVISFESFFAPVAVDSKAKAKYAKSGTIPYRATCSLYEIKNPDSKRPLSKRLSGDSQFYLIDPDGKVSEKRVVSLDKMCPS